MTRRAQPIAVAVRNSWWPLLARNDAILSGRERSPNSTVLLVRYRDDGERGSERGAQQMSIGFAELSRSEKR